MTNNVDTTLMAITYNLIFSDEVWAEFHDVVLEVMGKDLALPGLLAIYNQLPEYVQAGARGFGLSGIEYHLHKLQDDALWGASGVEGMVNENPNVVWLKGNRSNAG